MGGKRRTVAERDIIFKAAIAGQTLEEVNSLLLAAGYRTTPADSYAMVCHSYAPVLIKYPNLFQEYCQHPPPVNKLPKF